MKDPYQAIWTLNEEIGICKSLLTIENSIKLNFFALHPPWHDEAIAELNSCSCWYFSFYLLRLCGKIEYRNVEKHEAQKFPDNFNFAFEQMLWKA